jgi:hypothetical protein
MHISDHGDIRNDSFSKDSQETSLSLAQGKSGAEKISSIVTSTYNTAGENSTSFTKASRPFTFQTRDCQSFREFNLHTPIVAVSTQSRTSNVKTSRSFDIDETSETDQTFIIYPKAGARFFGISYGMLISARSVSGWKYSIESFRAVPETALIFDFCHEGNLEGVKSLFERGEASPWDRDPKGQTPLLVRPLNIRHTEAVSSLL